MKVIHAGFMGALLLFFGLTVAAATGSAFESEAFRAMQAEKKPVLLHVHATWCRTCKAQAPILESLMKEPAFANVRLLEIDFDQQKEVLRQFNVVKQGTLIAYRGVDERGRSIGDTSEAGIRTLLERLIQ